MNKQQFYGCIADYWSLHRKWNEAGPNSPDCTMADGLALWAASYVPAIADALETAWAENEQLKQAVKAGLPYVAQWSLYLRQERGNWNEHVRSAFYQMREAVGEEGEGLEQLSAQEG